LRSITFRPNAFGVLQLNGPLGTLKVWISPAHGPVTKHASSQWISILTTVTCEVRQLTDAT
jgi:hypothetical protein